MQLAAASLMRHSALVVGQGSRRLHDPGMLRGAGLPCGPRTAPRHVAFSTAESQRQQRDASAAWGPPELLTADDRLAILDLCHRFDAAINTGQQHTMGQFFAAEAEVQHPKGTVQGVDALVAYFKAMEPMARGNRHLTCNYIVEAAAPGGAAARATAYRLLHRAASPPSLLASGTIEDEVVKSEEDGRWRFARRRFVMDPPVAAPLTP